MSMIVVGRVRKHFVKRRAARVIQQLSRWSTKSNSRAISGFERKLLIAVAILFLSFLPPLLFSIQALLQVQRSEAGLHSKYAREVLAAQELKLTGFELSTLMQSYVLTGSEPIIDQFENVSKKFAIVLGRLAVMPLTASAKATVSQIQKLQEERRKFEMPGITMRRQGASIEAVDAFFRRNTVPLTTAIVDDVDKFVADVTDAYATQRAANRRSITVSLWTLAITCCFTVILCLIVSLLIHALVEGKMKLDSLNTALMTSERALSSARKNAIETLAHDLRNPLTAILMASSYLIESNATLTSARRSSLLDIVHRSAEAMHRLVETLLDHARIESGSLSLTKEDVDLNDLLTGLVGQFRLVAEKKGVNIVQSTNVHIPILQADGVRIEQVFSNLLGNAIKFAPQGGTVHVHTDVSDRLLTISVEDNGPGMPPEQAQHVFERYWQAKETAAQGTGLGLAISKAIVEAHDGRISVRTALGRGSTFDVILPIPAISPPIENSGTVSCNAAEQGAVTSTGS